MASSTIAANVPSAAEVQAVIQAVAADLGVAAGAISTPSEIVDMALPPTCGIDTTASVTMPTADLAYSRPTYSSKQASFHQGVQDLPGSSDPLAGGAIAGCAYFASVLIIGISTLLYLRKQKRQAKELEGEVNESKTARSTCSTVGFLASLLVALGASAVLIAGLAKVSHQTDLAVSQITFLTDGLESGSQGLEGSMQAAQGYAMAMASLMSFGNLGCSAAGIPLVQLTMGQTIAAIPEYFAQWMMLPSMGLNPLVDHARDIIKDVDDTQDMRLVAICVLAIVTIISTLVLAGQYASAYFGYKNVRIVKVGGAVSLGVGALALVATSAAFGLATTALLAASEPCANPDVEFLNTIVPDAGLDRESLQYFMICDDSTTISNVLFQSECYGGYAGENVLSEDQLTCLPETDAFSTSTTIEQGNYAGQVLAGAGAAIPVRLSCSHVNPLYVDLAYNNICGDATAWMGAVWLSSLVFGLAVASLILITYNTTWRRQLAATTLVKTVDGSNTDLSAEDDDIEMAPSSTV